MLDNLKFYGRLVGLTLAGLAPFFLYWLDVASR